MTEERITVPRNEVLGIMQEFQTYEFGGAPKEMQEMLCAQIISHVYTGLGSTESIFVTDIIELAVRRFKMDCDLRTVEQCLMTYDVVIGD